MRRSRFDHQSGPHWDTGWARTTTASLGVGFPPGMGPVSRDNETPGKMALGRGRSQPSASLRVGVSWREDGNGCDENSPRITINNICTYDVANCFGQNLPGSRYLYVYVQP